MDHAPDAARQFKKPAADAIILSGWIFSASFLGIVVAYAQVVARVWAFARSRCVTGFAI
jgi:hypothetical protein